MPDTQATIDFSGQPDGGSGTTSTSAGVLLGGRFQIRELLGRGGGGDVYLAHDQLDGVDVAVKLYRPTSAQGRKRIIRELRALQLVDHPNIVRIIAHGEHDGQFYCAMTLIEGSPFPGHPGAVSWDMLAETTRRLLHALGSVHDAGLVHRDIKPDNVLVDASGQPIILDFGLARGAQIGTTVTKTGALLGTPHYLPPEQVWGHTPTPASDLYALGVMLYEALAGRLPYASTRFHQMLHQKLNEDPVHIQVHVPALPDHIADAIMRLLCREASGRPQSASDVLHHLNGEPIRPPWYGSTVLRDQLIDAARHRRSMTIRGPAGSGKTYTLQAAAAQLEQVLWLSPGRAPFSSLRPSFDPGRFADRQGAQQAVYELLSTYIERGVIIADDLPALDRWTQRLLQQMDGLCVLSSERGMGAPQPPTMTEDDLRHLFSGPEVIHHLKSDAAFELYRRTGGYPGAVRLTLQDWLSRGLCQSQGPGYITSRASLETLAAEDVPPNLPVTSELSGALHDVLEVMWLAWPHASPEQLSALLNLQDWQLELYAEDLQEMGLIEQLETGWRPLSRPQMSTREDQAALRMRIAASLPDPMDRVRIQLNAHEAPTPADLLATAHIWRRAGRREQMLATLERAIALGTEVTEAIETLCWSQGVTENTPGLARRFAALIEHRADYRDMVEQCVRARRLEDVAPPPEPWTSMPEFQAAFLATTGDEQRIVVEQARSWAETHGDDDARGKVLGWEGLLAARRGDWQTAVRHHQAAARLREAADLTTSSLLNAASAALQLDDLSLARTLGERARDLSTTHRMPRFEARAWWVLRNVDNRNGVDEANVEVIEAATRLRWPFQAALLLHTEAMISFRGKSDNASLVARQAAWAFERAGLTAGALHARCIAHAADESGDPSQFLDELMTHVRQPDVIIDALALLHRSLDNSARALFAEMVERLTPTLSGQRLGVYTLNEARQLVFQTPP